jgi:tetratricopeptide (TPR) repeat protein
VVYIRDKKWDSALTMLQKAEKLNPAVAGIRLNIGLAEYRQGKFQEAILAFLSAIEGDATSDPARYLLGLCYFLTQDYGNAVSTLQGLEEVEWSDLNFLYVLAISAWEAKQPELEQRTMARLVEIGGNSPEFHWLMGKAHLNREEYDDAVKEFEFAAQRSPKLPFVHFSLGEAYLKKQQFEKAKTEFLEDARIEPDVAFNYDQLGGIESHQQHTKTAEEYFRHALSLDPKLASSQYQLARVYQQEGNSAKALEADALLELVPDNSSAHYLRGQILQRLGRTDEAKAEMRRATEISNAARNKRQQELEGGVPDPELMQQSQS